MESAIDDRIFTIKIYSPTCLPCRNLISSKNRTCLAFPDEIPLDIWNGGNNHTEPFEGDTGIRFEGKHGDT